MKIIKPFIYFAAFYLIILPFWVDKYFGPVSIEQVLFTIQLGVKGVITSDAKIVKRFIHWCLIRPLVLTLLLLLLERYFRFLRPLFKYKPQYLLLLGGLLYSSYHFSLFSYVKHQFWNSGFDLYANNYIDPKKLNFKA